jgi:integrase/recombinase XerD
MSKKNELVASSSTSIVVNEDLKQKFKQANSKNYNIHDFMSEFLHQFISDQTKRAYAHDLDSFFGFLKSGDVYISHPSDIKGFHFQYYRDDLIEQGYSSATVNRKLVAIRSFIKWAMALKLIDYNPLDVVKLPKVQTESPTIAFTDQEVLQMINSPNLLTKTGRTHRLMMILLFSLGLRRSELVSIKVCDIYQDRGHYVLKIHGKGNKQRHLPLNNGVIHEIAEYMSFLKDENLELKADDYLIQSAPKGKNKKSMDGSTVYRAINRYAKELGINKKVSPHSCRATAISHLLDTQKTPIRDVAIFAGHSKITTTERYDKRRESLDNSAAYEVDYSKKKAS